MKDTIAEQILSEHRVEGELKAGTEIGLKIDQTLTQDATGTMVYLEFESLGIPTVQSTVAVSYVDHNILQADSRNADDHRFLQSCAAKFGVVFSPPGNGATELELRTPEQSSSAPDLAGGHDELRLESYPNPLLTQSTIRFALPEPADVHIRIYDVQGRLVRILVDEHKDAGMHQVLWNGQCEDGRRVASGVYWVKLTTGEVQESRRILVTR